MKYAINASGAPEAIGPYSQGTTAGRLVFTSGQIAICPNDKARLIDGGIREQTERIVDIVEELLHEVGCSLADVAQTTVFLKDIDDLPYVDEIIARRFSKPRPARSVVAACALPLNALVEIECVACR